MRFVRKLLVGLSLIALWGCGSSADEALEQTAEVAEATPLSSSTIVESTAPAAAPAEPLLAAFEPLSPGDYLVENLGTSFTFSLGEEWSVFPNTLGHTVLAHEDSRRPGDRDVVFLRPTILGDPTRPGAGPGEIDPWPLDDIMGWLDNLDPAVTTSEPEIVQVGGRSAVHFEAEVTDSAVCGVDGYCAGFVINTIDEEFGISGWAFEPGFQHRVYWIDEDDEAPLVIIVGTPSTDDSFRSQADALLSTVVFGAIEPHPIGVAPDLGAFATNATDSTVEAALTADDLVGIWASDAVGSPIPPFIVQLNADGTFAVALSEQELASAPVESGEWILDGARMTLNTRASGCPGVLERPALYDVELSDASSGAVRWTAVDDPCQLRMDFLQQAPLSPR